MLLGTEHPYHWVMPHNYQPEASPLQVFAQLELSCPRGAAAGAASLLQRA